MPTLALGTAEESTDLVSVPPSGSHLDAPSVAAAISPDARFVAFTSKASNLVSGDANGNPDVFVYDRALSAMTLESRHSDGSQAWEGGERPDISASGRFVTFTSAADLTGDGSYGLPDAYVRDRQLGAIVRASDGPTETGGNYFTFDPQIDDAGRYVAFESWASNLIVPDANAGAPDIFVYDRVDDTLRLVSKSSSGAQGNGWSFQPSISGNGRYVAFTSAATNLVDGDTNGVEDIFVHDLAAGTTRRVSVSQAGAQANAASFQPSLSYDGNVVAFESQATNLGEDDPNACSHRFARPNCQDIFAVQITSGVLERVSESSSGVPGNEDAFAPSVSGDGGFIAFHSESGSLVSGAPPCGLCSAVFLRDTLLGKTTAVSIASVSEAAAGVNTRAAVAHGGVATAFQSSAANLSSRDPTSCPPSTSPETSEPCLDIYVHLGLGVEAVQPPQPPPPPPPAPPPPPPPPPGPPPPGPPAPPPPARPSPPRCLVPRVVGLRLAAARVKIRRARCSVGRIRRARSRHVGRVLRQSPKARRLVSRGTRVNLVVGRR